ncbi:unnamed protein product [Pocillopora meandrina]|uniref:Integrase catalytic domain-containing protein n=1 Tax=Pocillopora meandrina TaxID=46732 RepID=A0AAU9XR22_9CNID|nr:unnamed protein product [Pocillopora meandrina]
MVLKTYYDFSNRGSYGGLERLHKATGVPVKKLKGITRKNLIYSLHKPVQRRYTTNPTVANSIDHQWAADLADMKNLSRYNKGIKYLLTVVDVLSKYAWEIFIVDRVLNTYAPSYKIKEYDETPIKGTFYEEELQKVDMDD